MEPTNAAGSALVGTWKPVVIEDRWASGKVVYPFGHDPVGLLTYDTTGHMTIQLMKRPHMVFAAGDVNRATPEEKTAAFDQYVAYFGTYRVHEAEGIVTHQVEGSLDPSYIGVEQRRPFALSGDQLELRPVWVQDGEQVIGIRRFVRMKEGER